MAPRSFALTSKYARGLSGVREDRKYESNPGAPPDNKAYRRWRRQWEESFPRTVKCALCPDWPGVTGDGPTTRQALHEHRTEQHR